MSNKRNRFKLINLIIITLCSSIFFGIAFADNEPVANDPMMASKYPEYQIEVIVFANQQNKPSLFLPNNSDPAESFPEHPGKFNRSGTVDFVDLRIPNDQAEDINLLLEDQSNKLKNSDYKIILHQATRFNLLPSKLNKKFFIQSDQLSPDSNFVADSDNFKGVLIITPIKNAFHLSLDGIFDNFRLIKSVKLKPTEVGYLDHPKFGILITMVEIK